MKLAIVAAALMVVLALLMVVLPLHFQVMRTTAQLRHFWVSVRLVSNLDRVKARIQSFFTPLDAPPLPVAQGHDLHTPGPSVATDDARRAQG